MRPSSYASLCSLILLAATVTATRADTLGEQKARFYYRDTQGRTSSVPVIHRYRHLIVHPSARVDPRIDPKLRRAATFAEERANAQSKGRCWHYVKHALVAAGVINSYPETAYAADAGEELVRKYGFHKLAVRDPYAAPLGSVLVYGDRNRGHVEIRTHDGFVSDYHSNNACFYRLRAVYAKF